MLRNSTHEYGRVTKTFHWLIALAIILLLSVGSIMSSLADALKPAVYNIHKLIGLTVLLLVTLRLCWRLINTQPAYPANLHKLLKVAAEATHKLLYACMFIMPVSGWIMSSAAGVTRHPHLFSIKLGLPIAENKMVAGFARDVHEVFAWILFALLLLHIGAALYHHFIRKDNILIRMLPKAKTRTAHAANDKYS